MYADAMNAISAIDAPPRPAPARDPRPRLGAFVVFVAGVMFAASGIGAISAMLGYAIAVHFGARRGAGELGDDLGRLWVFVVLIVVVNGYFVAGDPVVSVGRHALGSREGLEAGVFFSMRLLALYLAMALLVRTTPPEELAAGVHALIRPLSPRLARRVAFHSFVTMSFIPVFAAEFRRVRIAQSFRGGTLSGGLGERVRAARLLIVPLILSAIHRSSQLAIVSELRGLEGRLGDLLEVRSPRAVDLALPVVTLAVVVAARTWLG
jgi:energy-coupling factor transporter transmembrane protein EcfT